MDLAARLGRPPQSGSHDKDDIRIDGSKWNFSIWRENVADQSLPLDKQCAELIDDFPLAYLQLQSVHIGDFAAFLDVAAFFETAYVTIPISAEVIRKLSTCGIGLEVTAYPSAGSEPKGTEIKSADP